MSDAGPPDASLAPAPPSNLRAAPDDATGLTVSWTAPADADLAGVLVVRGDGVDVGFAPTDGMTYTVDSAVGDGQTVAFAGTETSFAFPQPVPGLTYTFRAWAWDTEGRYSASVVAQGVNNALPVQTGVLEVAVATPSVTVVTQPPHFALSGTAAYDEASDTLTVTLTVENQTGRVIFNPKVVIDGVGEGAVSGPLLGGSPYVYFGPEALAVGATVTRDLIITGVTGVVDPVVVDLHLVDAPMLLTGNYFDVVGAAATMVDLGAFVDVGTVPCDDNVFTLENANANGRCSWRPGVVSPDGRFMYVGHRSLPIVRRVDTTTWSTVALTDLQPGATHGSVDSIAWGPGGADLYAVLNVGGHAYANDKTGASEAFLVRLEAETMAEQARVQVLFSEVDGALRAREVAFSPDGTLAAVPVLGAGRVALIDVASMSVVDVDPDTAGTQSIDVSATSLRPKRAIFTPGGDGLVIGYTPGESDHLDAVDLASYAVTPIATVSTYESTGHMQFDAAGRLWVARLYQTDSSLSVFDLTTEPPTETTLSAGSADGTEDGHGLLLSADGTRAYATNGYASELFVHDVETLERIDLDGDTANGTTNLVLGRRMGQHRIVVTPF